jgi:ribosomal 50S subunit-recycling heat shock protein
MAKRTSRKSEKERPEAEHEEDDLRLDKYLKNVGIVPRRAMAQEACRRGLIQVDGRPAKASHHVHAGQELIVRLGMKVRHFRVLEVPRRAVPRARREEYARLLKEETLGLSERRGGEIEGMEEGDQ